MGLAITAVMAGILANPPGLWVIVLVGAGVILANLCYRAAVSQAREVSTLLCVGFDLYRHEVLRRMDIAVPQSLEDERALWPALTSEVLDLHAPAIPTTRPPSQGMARPPATGT